MKVMQEFVVSGAPATVWEFFLDVRAVAGCLPGAELTGTTDENNYEGRMSVKLGPMSALFEGRASVLPDNANMSARIEGNGVDRKGGSRGRVKLNYSVSSDPAGSRVSVDADISLAGPVAQFGRTGLINETSKRLIDEFVACLESKLGQDRGTSDV